MINKNEIMLINYWMLIKKFKVESINAESEWANMIAKSQISKYENLYFNLWLDINDKNLQDWFIDDMVNKWFDIETIWNMINWKKFYDWALNKCFNS